MRKGSPEESLVKVKLFTKGKPITLVPGKDDSKTGLNVLVMTADISATHATGQTWWSASTEAVGMMIHELLKNNPELFLEIFKWGFGDMSKKSKSLKRAKGKKK